MIFAGTEANDEMALMMPTCATLPARPSVTNKGMSGEVLPPATLNGRKE
jgi:hypothetical protein